jgi:Domain of unknown function (DUF384)/Domain of unknown function (DUF383)
MDAGTLSSLTDLLSGSTAPKLRGAACAAVAASTSGDENAATRAAVGAQPALLRRLLALRGDPATGRLALSALVNIAEDRDASIALVQLRAVGAATAALLDSEQRPLSSLYTALLANLTRIPEGVAALVGNAMDFSENERRVAEGTLLRLAENLATLPNSLFLANACSNEHGRHVLLSASADDPRRQPLNALLDLLRSDDKDNRLAAASALRNCALAEASHAALVQRTDVIGVALVRLMSPTRPIPESDLVGAPKEVLIAAAAPLTLNPEPYPEIRLMIVEALLLMCQSRAGRDALRTSRAYPVLREWHLQEEDEGVKGAVEAIVDRTELLTEERGVRVEVEAKAGAPGKEDSKPPHEEGAETPTIDVTDTVDDDLF